MSEIASAAITTVLSVLVIVDIVGNSLVCVIMKRNRDMRASVNYLLVNLAAADVLYAVFMVPRFLFQFSFTHPDGGTGTVLCKLLTAGIVAWIGTASSVITLAAIAVERYYAVMYPLSNRGDLTKCKLKIIIPGIWLFALLFNIPLFLVTKIGTHDSSHYCVEIFPEHWMRKVYPLTWIALIDLSLAMMVFLYSKVVRTLWFKRNDDTQLTCQQKGVIRVRKRVTLMVLAVTAIFGICWGTASIVYVLHYITSYNIGFVPIACANIMILFNSAVNPFIYALLNQQFREKAKAMIFCTCSALPRVHPTPETHDLELFNNTTHPTHITCDVSRVGCIIEQDRLPRIRVCSDLVSQYSFKDSRHIEYHISKVNGKPKLCRM